MEVVSDEGYGFLLLVGEFDFGRIEVRIEFALHGPAFGGRSVGDQVDDGLICFEWPSAPVMGDPKEKSVKVGVRSCSIYSCRAGSGRR